MISAEPTADELTKVGHIPQEGCIYLVNRAAKGWAIVAFFDRSEHDIELAVYGEGNWATRQFLTSVFWYVFNQLGCSRCTAKVAASNLKAFRMDLRLGFQLEGVIRGALGDQDICLLGMLREECRWLPAGDSDEHR